jgi:hypothetical protein
LSQAIEAMEQLCGMFPSERDPQNHLGLMCVPSHRPCCTCIMFNPPSPPPCRYAAAGRHADAQRSFTNHPRPRDALSILHNLATVTVQLGQVDSAISMFHRIISIDAMQDTAHKALGVILGKTGDLKAAPSPTATASLPMLQTTSAGVVWATHSCATTWATKPSAPLPPPSA